MRKRNDGLITILIGTTRARIRIAKEHPYMLMMRDGLKKSMSDYEWDPRRHVLNLMYRYYYYSKARSELVIPINALKPITEELDVNAVPYEIKNEELVEGRKIDVKMIDGFKLRPDQEEMVARMVSDDPQRIGVSTMTGGGKTVMTIAAIVRRGKAAMVVVSGLTTQWEQSFRKFTNIGERCYVVKGIKSLMDLMEMDERPDVIIFSLETLRLYMQRASGYEDLPSYEQFIKYFGIEVKVADESHLCFHEIVMADLHSNIKKNIYLTATFIVGSAQTRRIFNTVFPQSMIFGADKRDRYIRVWSYGYRIYVPEKVYMKLRGYSHVKYEAYFYKHEAKLKHFFETVLVPVINAHYHNKCKKGQRCLIYFATIDMIMCAKQYLEKEFPTRKVGVYIGESEDGAYNNFEIVVSNHRKAGTGLDMKELYTVINTVSFATPTLTEQSLGRLRKLPSGDTPEYIDLVNITCGAQLQHRGRRKEIQERLALEYKESVLP